MRRYHVWLAGACAAVAAALAVPAQVQAQGYGLYEHNACAMARAGTGVASPCADGSAMFFNPAGLASLSGRVASVGGVLINTSGSFTNDISGQASDLKDGHYFAPNAYVAMPIGPKFVAGLGLFAPYGLTTEWPTTAEGRFLGYRSRIASVYLQPTIAMKANDQWSFGAGFDLNFMSVELRQRVDLSTQQVPGMPFTFASLGIAPGTDFADANLTGNGTGVGYHLGVQFKANDRLSFGLRYLSRQLVKFTSATANFAQVPTGIVLAGGNPLGAPAGTPLDAILASKFLPDSMLSSQGGSTWLRVPEQLVGGVAYKFTPRLTGMFDIQWTNWATFDSLQISFDRLPKEILAENYKAVVDWRLGGEYQLNDATVLRAGVLAHKGAAPDTSVTPNLPEGNRTEFTLGAGTRLTPTMDLDVALQLIDQADRRGRSGNGPINGLYAFSAYLIGASLVYRF